MLKIENTEVVGFEHAFRGMRNPLNSWDKSDSHLCDDKLCPMVEFGHESACGCTDGEISYCIGKNDMDLAKRLANAGTDHSKFLRMIVVYADITAPMYWVAELDTYKVGTVRNSCSLQHKGASRDFNIRDFTVIPEVYETLSPIKTKKEHKLVYEDVAEDDFKLYKAGDREYKVFSNGKIVALEFERKDTIGNRTKHFKEKTIKPSQNRDGYYCVNLGGRVCLEKWTVHRLVATLFLEKPNGDYEVNHKDGNKGNNNVSNLEWVTHSENEIHKNENGLSGRTIHTNYTAYKNGYKSGKYINKNNRNTELFELSRIWEENLENINSLRSAYVETNDYDYFLAMRSLMPMGYEYKFTWCANYQVLRTIYHARKNHLLPEWHTFCDWIEGLPYAKELICDD